MYNGEHAPSANSGDNVMCNNAAGSGTFICTPNGRERSCFSSLSHAWLEQCKNALCEQEKANETIATLRSQITILQHDNKVHIDRIGALERLLANQYDQLEAVKAQINGLQLTKAHVVSMNPDVVATNQHVVADNQDVIGENQEVQALDLGCSSAAETVLNPDENLYAECPYCSKKFTVGKCGNLAKLVWKVKRHITAKGSELAKRGACIKFKEAEPENIGVPLRDIIIVRNGIAKPYPHPKPKPLKASTKASSLAKPLNVSAESVLSESDDASKYMTLPISTSKAIDSGSSSAGDDLTNGLPQNIDRLESPEIAPPKKKVTFSPGPPEMFPISTVPGKRKRVKLGITRYVCEQCPTFYDSLQELRRHTLVDCRGKRTS